MSIAQHVRAFAYGVMEYRSSLTLHFDDPYGETYDRGRDLAHRLTFRRFES